MYDYEGNTHMKFLYRILILAIAALLCLYLVKFPLPSGIEEALTGIEDPVRDQYNMQQGLSRNFLNEPQQLIYDVIYQAIDDQTEKVSIPVGGYVETDIKTVLLSLLNDCPGFFWIDYSDCSYAFDDYGTTFYLSYLYKGAELEIMRKQLDDAVADIVQKTRAIVNSGEYDMAVYTHDLIAATCEYDKTLSAPDIHNAYGALVSKKAVCDGYAHAYQMVLQQLNIECHYVSGEARGPNGAEGHAWNIIKIGEEYTTVDLTWNDIDSYLFEDFIAPSEDITSHIYFGISSEEMKQTHKVDEDFIYELPEAIDMNWYRYNELIGATPEEVADKASDKLIENIYRSVPYVEFILTDKEAFDAFLEEYNGTIIDMSNLKLQEMGEDRTFMSEMNCFVTNKDKGCILVLVELDTTGD